MGMKEAKLTHELLKKTEKQELEIIQFTKN